MTSNEISKWIDDHLVEICFGLYLGFIWLVITIEWFIPTVMSGLT